MASLTLHGETVTKPPASSPSKLPAYLDRVSQIDSEFIVFDDGYRGWTYSYRGYVSHGRGFFEPGFDRCGIHKGERVMIWSENRPGWIAALWGCLLEGVVVVPMDQRSSARSLLTDQG